MTVQEIRAALEARKDRSAWNRGVTAYALDLLDAAEAYAKSPTVGKLWDAMQEKDAKAAETAVKPS